MISGLVVRGSAASDGNSARNCGFAGCLQDLSGRSWMMIMIIIKVIMMMMMLLVVYISASHQLCPGDDALRRPFRLMISHFSFLRWTLGCLIGRPGMKSINKHFPFAFHPILTPSENYYDFMK